MLDADFSFITYFSHHPLVGNIKLVVVNYSQSTGKGIALVFPSKEYSTPL